MNCTICGNQFDTHGYADVCDTCAADPAAAFLKADEDAAEEAQCQAADHAETGFGGYLSQADYEASEAAATRADWASWYGQDA